MRLVLDGDCVIVSPRPRSPQKLTEVRNIRCGLLLIQFSESQMNYGKTTVRVLKKKLERVYMLYWVYMQDLSTAIAMISEDRQSMAL